MNARPPITTGKFALASLVLLLVGLAACVMSEGPPEHRAVVLESDGRYVVEYDGRRSPEFGFIDWPTVRGDGKFVAFWAVKQNREYRHDDPGNSFLAVCEVGPGALEIRERLAPGYKVWPVYAPKGELLVYRAVHMNVEQTGEFAGTGARMYGPWREVGAWPVFSDDRTKAAYVVKDEEGWRLLLVTTGEKSPTFDRITDVRFDASGNTIKFRTGTEGQSQAEWQPGAGH